MKRDYLVKFSVLMFFILTGSIVIAQCPPGDLQFNDQDDVDAFAAEYPDCTEINGSLEIDPLFGAGFLSLEFFENITSINGDFKVERDINAISAFTGLQVIGGDLEFASLNGSSAEEIITIPSGITTLGGDFKMNNSDSVIVAGMEGLSIMAGNLMLSNVDELVFNALPNVESLLSIDIYSCSEIFFNSGLSSLLTITGYVQVYGNSSGQIDFGGLVNLQSVASYFRILGCEEGELSIVNLDFDDYVNEVDINSNDALISFSSCFFGNQIGSVSVNNSNVTDIGFFAGVEEVTGNIQIVVVQELQSVQALDDLIHVGGSFHIEEAPGLTDFSGPSSVLEIEGELILSGLGLETIGGASTDAGFASLISVGGDITLSEMPNIQGLTEIGFWQLQNVGGSTIGIYNTGAVQISALQNLVNFNGTLVLAFNPQMALCDIPFTCMFPQQVAFNMNGQEAFGCQDWGQLNCLDFGQVQGQVFADFNCDNIMNGEDVGIPIHQLMSEESLLGFTNSEGAYEIDLSFTDYDLFSVAPLFGFENDNLYNFTGDGSVHIYDFPMCPTDSEVSNLSVSVSPIANPPMPGFTNQYEVCVANLGTENSSGTLSFEIPDFNGVTIADAESGTVDGNSVSWTVEELGPFESMCFVVVVQIDTGTLGQVFNCVGTIETEDGVADDDPSNNTHTLQQTIVGSYDPNDKLVNHELVDVSNYDNDSLFTLEYLIRFQNTGTAPATFVRVTDLLPTELDPITLEMIHASHEYELSFEPANEVLGSQPKLEWYFDDINLADSASNEPESHGFIHFRINTVPYINPGDVIENFVSIFFDYNEAVITEDAVTEFIECDEESLTIAAPNEICASDTALLTASLAGFETYTWTVDGQEITAGQQIQAPFTNSGDVELTVTNPTCTLSTSLELTLNEQPEISVQLGPYITCDSTIEIGVMANGEVNWYLADSLVATGDPAILSQSGSYVVTNENSCGMIENGVEVKVHQLDLDVPEFVCAGESILLNPVYDGYDAFEWIVEGEEYSGDSLVISFSGDGPVQLVASSDECSLTLNYNLEVVEQPYTNMILEPWLGCYGEVEIDLEPNGEVTWYLEDEIVTSGNPVTIYNSGLYQVTVENECGMIENDVAVEVYDIPDEVTLIFDGEQLVVSPEGTDYQWFLDGLPLSSFDGPSITPTEIGDYSVIVYFENSICSQTSNIVFVPVAINELLGAQITLYPNPAKDFVTIELPQGQWQLNLMDAVGKRLQSVGNITDSRYDLQLKELAPGAYFVQVSSDEGFVVKKLVVE